MYINKSDAEKFINDKIDGLGEKLSGDIKSLFSILDDDSDWAFFIKLNAYVELLLSNGIKAHFNEESLESSFEKLPLIDSGFGKTHIAKSIGLITKEHETFIRRLAEIRNILAHNFNAIDFSLAEYLESMEKNRRKSFIKQVTYMNDECLALFEVKPQVVFILNIVFMSAEIEHGLFVNRQEEDIDNLELKCLREFFTDKE